MSSVATGDPYRPLKDAFGKFATGVAVAACRTGDSARAITINSFTSVSLEPPLILWCVEKTAGSYDDFMRADAYAVSVLPADAMDLSDRFAMRGAAPLQREEHEIWETGAPILKRRLAGLDCRVAARHDAGDHVILVGEVVRFDSREGDPLIYFASQYQAAAPMRPKGEPPAGGEGA